MLKRVLESGRRLAGPMASNGTRDGSRSPLSSRVGRPDEGRRSRPLGPVGRRAASWLILGALLQAAHPAFALDCGYTPKASEENPQPEFMPHSNCGEVSGDTLLLEPAHLQNLTFGENGLAFVLTKEGVFYVDRSGRSVRTFWYDMSADDFAEGLARGIIGDKFGFIDESLDFVIEPAYDFAFPFARGFAVVCNGCKEEPAGEHRTLEGGVWGLIDRRGRVVVPLEHSKDGLKTSPAYLELGI